MPSYEVQLPTGESYTLESADELQLKDIVHKAKLARAYEKHPALREQLPPSDISPLEKAVSLPPVAAAIETAAAPQQLLDVSLRQAFGKAPTDPLTRATGLLGIPLSAVEQAFTLFSAPFAAATEGLRSIPPTHPT